MTRTAALLSPHPESTSGGVERFCALVGDLLVARGWEAHVVGPTQEPGRWVWRLGGGPLAEARVAAAAARAVDPQLIVSNGYLGGFAPHVPRVHVFHGTLVGLARSAVDAPGRQRVRMAVGGGVAERLSTRGATTVAVSQRVADEVHRVYRHRVDAVIPNGVDTERFAPRDRAAARARLDLPAGERIALFVGRMEPTKGADALSDMCAGTGWTLAVAGGDAPPGAYGLGVLDHEQLAVAYDAADCLLFPTYYEGCSYVVLEAMASGLPVVSTPTGWMPTLLHAVPDYAALIAPVRDTAAFARVLRDWPDDGHAALVAQASAFVREHNSLTAWSRSWGALLEPLL
jgi:glycosyltransferase involved in cell wall biosynthesis